MNNLLIDDTRDPAEYQVNYLGRDYKTGIHLLKAIPIDRLYLDIELGKGKSGFDVINWLRENKQYRPKDIIMITSSEHLLPGIWDMLKDIGYDRMTLRKFTLIK